MVLASEGNCLCGVDVAAPQHLRRGRQQPLLEDLQSFRKQFTAHEVRSGRASGPFPSQPIGTLRGLQRTSSPHDAQSDSVSALGNKCCSSTFKMPMLCMRTVGCNYGVAK